MAAGQSVSHTKTPVRIRRMVWSRSRESAFNPMLRWLRPPVEAFPLHPSVLFWQSGHNFWSTLRVKTFGLAQAGINGRSSRNGYFDRLLNF